MTNKSAGNIEIQIKGLVQGVGFRPFVYRSALHNNISGWVQNNSEGVIIEASGEQHSLDIFLSEIRNNYPVAANISDIKISASLHNHQNGFEIVFSDASHPKNEITQIGPDIAVCKDCLKDMNVQTHRIDYPFINCTHCGPRFSIIRDLPYDRQQTTMDAFEMCTACRSEYENPLDRRFHAQPVSCAVCGPRYKFSSYGLETSDTEEVIKYTCEYIGQGKIVAIKGIGGFFIACDAQNEKTIERLRAKKSREGKPLAVMFRDMDSLHYFCYLDESEKEVLSSWQKPILILQSKGTLPDNVSSKLHTIGALLPYMPIHYLLFSKLQTPAIVFTSGNISDQPIVISNKKAETDLAGICDAVVSYNRKISNRTDDSLIRVMNGKSRMIRRSRGFAPGPVDLKLNVEGILGTGAELKNTFCIGKGNQAILSQHIGDLKDLETFSFYENNIEQFKKMFRFQPKVMACDLHPDYLSSVYATETGLPLYKVQHHHAHIASAMVENDLDEPLIGVCFDGTGLGADGKIWGSEFFICDLMSYEQKMSFEPVPLPGGDKAILEPWRIAVSWLYKIFGSKFLGNDLPFLKSVGENEQDWIIKSIQNKLNSPLSRGAGRLFDAVSALLGLCNYSSFEAEAPMRLENCTVGNEAGIYPFGLAKEIELSAMFFAILEDMKKDVDIGIISTRFHNTISEVIVQGVHQIYSETGLRKVVLSGGTFLNKYLTELTENRLQQNGFQVFGNRNIPCNDGGIALGQLLVAAKRISTNRAPDDI